MSDDEVHTKTDNTLFPGNSMTVAELESLTNQSAAGPNHQIGTFRMVSGLRSAMVMLFPGECVFL